tara:strand:- start:99 stop:389 length:291 start_codon:yes stop_codon:yes gene_type:complete
MGLPASRFGDFDVPHCSPMTRAGVSNVFINGRMAQKIGDFNTEHLFPSGTGCAKHIAPIGSGSSTVRINGLPAARTGDSIKTCTFVGTGSTNVFIG